MAKSKYIPEFTQIKVLCKEQSEIKASKFVEGYNEGKQYGERIIESQMHTIHTIITDYWRKAKHRLASGRRLFITVGNLAKMCKCSAKTAYNHIKRLITAGVLRKRFTTHNFDGENLTPCLELEINPKILHFQVLNQPVAVEKPVDSAQVILPGIDPKILANLRQMGFWTDSA